jgi:hypothetical protein
MSVHLDNVEQIWLCLHDPQRTPATD